jgi:hypothetical protein
MSTVWPITGSFRRSGRPAFMSGHRLVKGELKSKGKPNCDVHRTEVESGCDGLPTDPLFYLQLCI